MNLTELLKGHEGETFYSTAFGNIKLELVDKDYLEFETTSDGSIEVDKNGVFSVGGECIVFPSKTQRSWEKWKEDHDKIDTWEKLKPKIKYYQINLYEEFDDPVDKSISAFFKIKKLIERSYSQVKDINLAVIHLDTYRRFKEITIPGCDYKSPFLFPSLHEAKRFLSHPDNQKLLREFYGID